MQNFVFEKLPEEPIVLVTLSEGWEIRADMEEFLGALHTVLESCQSPVYCIVDVIKTRNPSLDDLIWGANAGTRGASAIVRHRNLREFLTVSQSSLLTLAAKGVRSDVFGNVPISVYPTLEEALAYARAHP